MANFRYDFVPTFRKAPVSANIIVTGDDFYTLYVNGELIGRGYSYTQSRGYCVKLGPGINVFAVAVQNGGAVPNPAGLLAAISVTYSDGTTSTIVSDANWRANGVTAGFQNVGFDDSTWPSAVVIGNSGDAPWHVTSLPISTSTLTLANSYWIWNNQVPPNSPLSTAPIGSFAFRKTYKATGGSSIRSGTIIIDADNEYILYINGIQIGSASFWPKAERWTFTLDSPTDNIVLAVDATNEGGPAGFIVAAAFNVEYADCSTTLVEVTSGTQDGTWKFDLTVPSGFQQPGYNDSTWPSTIVEGPYGVGPWGSVPIVDGN